MELTGLWPGRRALAARGPQDQIPRAPASEVARHTVPFVVVAHQRRAVLAEVAHHRVPLVEVGRQTVPSAAVHHRAVARPRVPFAEVARHRAVLAVAARRTVRLVVVAPPAEAAPLVVAVPTDTGGTPEVR